MKTAQQAIGQSFPHNIQQYFKYAEASEAESIAETKLITQNKHKKAKKLASWRQTSLLFTSVVED